MAEPIVPPSSENTQPSLSALSLNPFSTPQYDNSKIDFGNITPLTKSVANPKIQSYIDAIKGIKPDTESNPFKQLAATLSPVQQNRAGKVDLVKYDVPIDALYTQLNDGSYQAKFENYLGAVGNEDRLARQQGFFEQAGHGIEKFALKTLGYAADATIGTVAGIFSSIERGSWDGFYENNFSKMVDDWNTKLDFNLPNYRSDEEKSRSFLGKLSSPTEYGNFIFDDFLGGAAFVAGAILPDVIIGAATGGTAAPALLTKLGFSLGLKGTSEAASIGKSLLKKSTGAIINPLSSSAKIASQVDRGMDLMRAARWSNFAQKSADILKTSDFLVRSSGFEAGMEARHNYKDAMDNFMTSYKERNGRDATPDEIADFSDKARKASNYVFYSNMAVLGLSNAAMFGARLGLKLPSFGIKANRFGNNLIGLGLEKNADATLALKAATKAQRFTGNVYKALEKSAIEGIYEEGLQGVITKTSQNYLESKYSPNQQGHQFWSSLSDAFAEQYGTKEGWNEMGMGMLIGYMAGPVQKQGFSGFARNSRKAVAAQLENDISIANKGVQTLRSTVSASSLKNYRDQLDSDTENAGTYSVQNSMMNAQFIKSQQHLKTKSEIKNDFANVVNNTQLELDGLSPEDIQDYKTNLIDNFHKSVDDYQFADQTVNRLQLPPLSVGDHAELSDVLKTQIYLGQQAQRGKEDVANQISTLTGIGGLFDALDFYNNLESRQQQVVKELSSKQKQLQRLQTDIYKFSETSSSIAKGKSERYIIAQQQVQKLEAEIQNITNSLQTKANTNDLDFTNVVSNKADVTDVVSKLDNLQNYSSSLRSSGKSYEANQIDYLIDQFKGFADAHYNTNNFLRKLVETNYFSTKEGKGLVEKIIGPKYNISPEFSAALKDNEEYIHNSFRAAQLGDYEDVETAVQEFLAENPNLSSREKYLYENLIKAQLGVEAVNQRIEKWAEQSEDYSVFSDVAPNPLEGDTISIKRTIQNKNRQSEIDKLRADKQKLERKKEKINNSDLLRSQKRQQTSEINRRLSQIDATLNTLNTNLGVQDLSSLAGINSVIDEITSQIDNIRDVGGKNQKKQLVENELNSLIVEKQNIINSNVVENEQQAGDYEKIASIVSSMDDLSNSSNPEEFAINTNLLAQYPKLTELLQNGQLNPLLEIDKKIQEASSQLAELESGTSITDSEDFKRLNQLLNKQRRQEITIPESAELEDLKAEMDAWIPLAGTVADGLRLSDLIEQKQILENTVIAPTNSIDEIGVEDLVANIEIADKTGAANYSNAQNYDAATVVRDKKTGLISISGISPQAFFNAVGYSATQITDADELGVNSYMLNEKNNILISDEASQNINEKTNLFLGSDISGMATTYGVVLNFAPDINGQQLGLPLRGDFDSSTTDQMNVEALYDMDVNDTLTLVINPNDSYNASLLEEYKRNPSDDIFKQGLIRVVDSNNNFTSVLKGWNENATKTNNDLKFEALREQYLNNPEIIDTLLSGETVTINLPLKANGIYLGHPNFNYVKTDNGIAIRNMPLTSNDINKIIDVGYVENGKVYSKSGQEHNKTFLNSAIRRGTKTPFIVVQKGLYRVAFPARLIPQETPSTDNLVNIFNSNADNVTKVLALNKELAALGVDVKSAGNAFYALGDQTNLTTTFLNEKIAQIENKEYFSDPKDWMNSNVKLADILPNLMVNINLSNPLHSPKLRLDYSEVQTKEVIRREAKSEKNKTKNKKASVSAISQALAESRSNNEFVQEADKQLKEDC